MRLSNVNNQEQILISLAPRHAKNIFAGKKQIELRRRSVNVEPGTIVWIYVTLPIGSIIGQARITAIHKSSPDSLWKEFGAVSGLSKSEFLDYLTGLIEGVVLVLADAKILAEPFSLEALRSIADGFNPPQFFVRINEEHPLFETFTNSSHSFQLTQHLPEKTFSLY
jgi:predicted transcriptional regulator